MKWGCEEKVLNLSLKCSQHLPFQIPAISNFHCLELFFRLPNICYNFPYKYVMLSQTHQRRTFTCCLESLFSSVQHFSSSHTNFFPKIPFEYVGFQITIFYFHTKFYFSKRERLAFLVSCRSSRKRKLTVETVGVSVRGS